MRLYSFRSIILGTVCLVAAILLAPIIVLVMIVAALFVPGMKLISRTSDRYTLNLASFHSPRSMIWSWVLSFSRPRSADEGRWLGAYLHPYGSGYRFGLQIARYQIMFSRQKNQALYPIERFTMGRSTG